MTDFRARAACRDVDPELFFSAAEPGTAVYARDVAAAKAVCRRCPAATDCLAFALDYLPDGVAGGLDADERRELRQRLGLLVRTG